MLDRSGLFQSIVYLKARHEKPNLNPWQQGNHTKTEQRMFAMTLALTKSA
jgi:hypothetical protein